MKGFWHDAAEFLPILLQRRRADDRRHHRLAAALDGAWPRLGDDAGLRHPRPVGCSAPA